MSFDINKELEDTTAKSRFTQLDQNRSSVLTRARDCSSLTLPSVLPADGHTEETTLETPYQGLGARLVNGLASKLLLALLPPNTNFFRLMIKEEVRDTAERTGRTQELDRAENTLVSIEQEALKQMEKEALRVPSFELFKSLIITGNSLGYKTPTGLKSYKLDQYVVQRDFEGSVTEIITKEMKSKYSLPDDLLNAIEFESEEETEVAIYTRAVLREGTWYEWQEVGDTLVNNSLTNYKKEKNPYIPLRWTSINGENYGRGLVEQYLGDFRNLEALYQLTVETAAVQARTIFGIRPGSLTDMDALNKATNGEVVSGDLEEDLTVLRVEKGSDLNIPLNLIETLTRRLEQAFLSATSAVRDSERTTLGEIRFLASDLEESLGGVYSILSQEFQLPLANVMLNNIETQVDMEGLDLIIVTGVEALGRNNDIEKLRQLNGLLQELGSPERVLEKMNIDNYINDIAKNLGLPEGRYIKGQEQLQAEQQQAASQQLEQQAATNMVDNATQQQG